VRAVGILKCAAVLVVIFAGCQRAEDRYLTREVSSDEVAGTWQMTPETVKDLWDAGYTIPIDPMQHHIVFRSDGTCDFQTLPKVLTEAGTPAPRIEAPCRWKLGDVGHQAVLVDIESNPQQRVYYYFRQGAEARLLVWQHTGDPDVWRYVEYAKQ